MRKTIIANWKGKRPDDIHEWFRKIQGTLHPSVEVILCPGHNDEKGFELRKDMSFEEFKRKLDECE